MRHKTLKSTTALVVAMSMTTPALAQDVQPFPCVIGNGQTVEDATALAQVLTDSLALPAIVPEAPADPAVQACSTEAVNAAAAEGGDALAAILATAGPDQIAALLPDVDMTATGEIAVGEAPSATDQPAADQAAAEGDADAQAASDQAAADAAAAEQAAADQAAADAAAAEQAAADQAAADAAAAEQAAADQAAADAAAAEQAAADQAAADAAAAEQAAADQAAADAAAAEQAAADQAAADADAAIAAQAETPAADPTVTAETDAQAAPAADSEEPVSTIEQDTTAESSTPPATAEPTPEELAARVAEREAARQASAAAAAAASTDATAMANDPEVVTEEVTESDVRTADEDFDTAVDAAPETTADAAVDTTATASADNGGLSNFEKALVLGLGALTVGAILNNGDEVVSNSGDRVVVQRDGELRVLKNDDVLLRQPGAQVATRTFEDGSTLTTVTRQDGSVVTTIRASDGTVLRRTLTTVDGTQVALIDDLDTTAEPVEIASLPPVPREVTVDTVALTDQAALEAALTANLLANTGRTYSLEQVREIRQVRALAPQVELATITFETGSAAIQPSQAEQLAALGGAIRQIVANDPSAVFLVEGHTDAVGDAGYNLALSDRRAETVALALAQYFQVPPENLVTQGYGERFLKIDTQTSERANRRAAVRNITDLLQNS